MGMIIYIYIYIYIYKQSQAESSKNKPNLWAKIMEMIKIWSNLKSHDSYNHQR